MTRKDYVLIAEVIRTEADTWSATSLQGRAISSLAYRISEALHKDNPRFDSDRFIKACMPQ